MLNACCDGVGITLSELCPVCMGVVCADCAVFVDPETRMPTLPSKLLSQGITSGFLAHRLCVPVKGHWLVSCVPRDDVPLMVDIVKNHPLF